MPLMRLRRMAMLMSEKIIIIIIILSCFKKTMRNNKTDTFGITVLMSSGALETVLLYNYHLRSHQVKLSNLWSFKSIAKYKLTGQKKS